MIIGRFGLVGLGTLAILCVPALFPPDANLAAGETDVLRPVNLIIFAQGQVSFKRKGWSSYAPAAFGTALQLGDLVNVADSSRVQIVCSDLSLHDIPPGIVGVPCQAVQPLLRKADGSVINVTRGRVYDGSFPLILSPRKTKVLSSNPILRWAPVPGAKSYLVTVRGTGLYWTSAISGTEVAYPISAPTLQANKFYKLIVEVGDQSSSQEPGPYFGFSILDVKDRNIVIAEQQRIERLGLPEGPTRFLVALLFAAHGLNAEAIQMLEDNLQKFQAAAVARILGDLYIEVGLPRQAEGRYLKSIELAKAEKNLEVEMMAHLALAQIYERALGNSKSAGDHRIVALDLAKILGDDYTTSQITNQLNQTKKAAK
jgi:hypothetical protein